MRLTDYDYSQAGVYFVTVCTHERELLLADQCIRNIVWNAWRDLARRFSHVRLDEFVIMPNHIHAIVWILDRNVVGAQHLVTFTSPLPADDPSNASHIPDAEHAAPLHPAVAARSLGAIVRSFKSVTAKRVNRLRGTPEPQFWQRNYYEHVIRDEDELTRIRQYILDNPAKWAEDPENPSNW